MMRSAKRSALTFLAHESLRHANTGDGFRERRRDAAPAFLHLAIASAQFLAEMTVQRPQHGRHGQHHQEQYPIVPQHQHRTDEHLAQLNGAHEQRVLHPNPHRLGIGREPADDPSQLGAIVKTHRHPQQMLEDVVADVVDDRLAQLEGKPLTEMETELGNGRKRQEPERRPDDALRVVAPDGPIDR